MLVAVLLACLGGWLWGFGVLGKRVGVQGAADDEKDLRASCTIFLYTLTTLVTAIIDAASEDTDLIVETFYDPEWAHRIPWLIGCGGVSGLGGFLGTLAFAWSAGSNSPVVSMVENGTYAMTGAVLIAVCFREHPKPLQYVAATLIVTGILFGHGSKPASQTQAANSGGQSDLTSKAQANSGEDFPQQRDNVEDDSDHDNTEDDDEDAATEEDLNETFEYDFGGESGTPEPNLKLKGSCLEPGSVKIGCSEHRWPEEEEEEEDFDEEECHGSEQASQPLEDHDHPHPHRRHHSNASQSPKFPKFAMRTFSPKSTVSKSTTKSAKSAKSQCSEEAMLQEAPLASSARQVATPSRPPAKSGSTKKKMRKRVFALAILAGVCWGFGPLGKKLGVADAPADRRHIWTTCTYLVYMSSTALVPTGKFVCSITCERARRLRRDPSFWKYMFGTMLCGCLSGAGGLISTMAFAMSGGYGALVSIVENGTYTIAGAAMIAILFKEWFSRLQAISAGLVVLGLVTSAVA